MHHCTVVVRTVEHCCTAGCCTAAGWGVGRQSTRHQCTRSLPGPWAYPSQGASRSTKSPEKKYKKLVQREIDI